MEFVGVALPPKLGGPSAVEVETDLLRLAAGFAQPSFVGQADIDP